MPFERFTKVGSRQAPKISIRAGGSFGLSQGALNRFRFEQENTHVVLFYDADRKLIGIKPTANADEEGAIKVNVRPYRTGEDTLSKTAFFSAKSFLDFYEIPYEKTRSFDAKWDKENEMIIIDLNA